MPLAAASAIVVVSQSRVAGVALHRRWFLVFLRCCSDRASCDAVATELAAAGALLLQQGVLS
jgi:hypothetical protein